MKKDSNIFSYFVRGAKLLCQSYFIIITSILFTVFPILIPLNGKSISFIGFLSLIIHLFFILFYFSFEFSIPLLFQKYQKKERITITLLKEILVRNARRIVIDLVIILVMVGISTIGIKLIGTVVFHISNAEWIYILSPQATFSIERLSLTLLISFVPAILIYTNIYFSIENFGIFPSIKKSILFSKKNIYFLVILLICTFLEQIITGGIYFINFDKSITRLIHAVVLSLINLLITSAALLYYQDHSSK